MAQTAKELSTLPKEIAKTKRLQQIDLAQNLFAAFPETLLSIKSIKKINLFDNTIPAQEIEKIKVKTAKRAIVIGF